MRVCECIWPITGHIHSIFHRVISGENDRDFSRVGMEREGASSFSPLSMWFLYPRLLKYTITLP